MEHTIPEFYGCKKLSDNNQYMKIQNVNSETYHLSYRVTCLWWCKKEKKKNKKLEEKTCTTTKKSIRSEQKRIPWTGSIDVNWRYDIENKR